MTAFSLALASCLVFGSFVNLPDQGVVQEAAASLATVPPPTAKAKAVTNRKPNARGRIPIVMYHRFEKQERYMVRSFENFRRDLERFYREGYRPITMAEYVDGSFDLPPGATPIVLTFDDSHESQFRLLKDGRVDPMSAVGIWSSFAKRNPDFPVKGTFFVLPNGPFGSKKAGKKKVGMLTKWGSEVASHSMTHRAFDRLSDLDVKKEMVRSMLYVKKLTGRAPRTIALPYGAVPKNRSLLHGFRFNGEVYRYEAVALAGSAPTLSPKSPRRNLQLVPRIHAFEGDYGLTWWLNRVASGRVPAYVTE